MIKLKSSFSIVLSAFYLTLAAGLFISAAYNRIWMHFYYIHLSFYLIFLLFLVWVLVTYQHQRTKPILSRSLWSECKWGILFSVVLAAIIFISVPPYFRVLADETNLLSISKSMLFDRTIENVTQGKWYYEAFHPLHAEDPKRPFLFSFLVYLIHLLTGYRSFNPFVLNFIVLAALFSTIFIHLRKRWGSLSAYSAVLLVASQPLIIQCATSGGFELLFLFMSWICFISLDAYLRDPSSVRLQLLWVHLILLANTRYEAPLLMVIVSLSLIFLRRVNWKEIGRCSHYALTPLLFIPMYWQRIYYGTQFEGFEEAPGAASMSLSYLSKNIKTLIDSLTRFDFYLPYASVICVVAIVSLVCFSYMFVRKVWLKNKVERLIALITCLCVIGHTFTILIFHAGDADHPSVSRYFILLLFVISMAAWILLNKLGSYFKKPAVILFFSVVMFLVYHPVSISDDFSKTQTLPRAYLSILKFLKQQDNQNILLVSDRPGLYTVQQYGAVKFDYANRNRVKLIRELNRGLYQDIYVIQEIYYKGNLPSTGTKISSKYELEKVFQLQKKSATFIRISKVVT